MNDREQHGHRGDHYSSMMTIMIVMCAGVLLLAVLLPALGFPLGLVAAVAASDVCPLKPTAASR